MISWRDGKAGFVGASKYLIKGLFSYRHSVTSEVPITADSFYASSGVINANALATIGMIIEEGGASTSLITDTFSSSGKIDDNAISSTGIIDPEGSASKGDI